MIRTPLIWLLACGLGAAQATPQSKQPSGAVGPVATLSAIQLVFKSIQLGTISAATPLTITNSGTDDLSVTSVSADGDFISDASACPSQLPAGQHCDIKIAFKPSATGTRMGTLTINDNAPGSPHTVKLEGDEQSWSSRFTRMYAGYAIAGASSADAQSQLLLGVDTEGDLGQGWYFWFSPRATSLSAPNPKSASGLSDATLYTSALAASPIALIQALEVNAGPEWMWGGEPALAVTDGSTAKFKAAGILGFGFVTPFSPSTLATSSPVLDVPAANCQTPPASGTTCAETFVPQSRDRFFYRYNAGVRFKTYYYDDGKLADRFPGTIDWTFGQDETVSGGKLRGLVMRLDANYPIPFLSHVNVFGSVGLMPFSQAKHFDTVLTTLDTTLTPTSAGVTKINVQAPNRDTFTIGVALDLASLYGH